MCDKCTFVTNHQNPPQQAKKNGGELNATDAATLESITAEQSGLQKQLEQQRKMFRQHQHLTQNYKTKQQVG